MKKYFIFGILFILVFGGCEKSNNKLTKLDNYFVKDNRNVYCFFSDNANFKLEYADPKTFQVLGNGYAKDKNNVYWNDVKIENADIETFEVMDDSIEYAKDKNNVYFTWMAQKNIENPETFEFIQNSIYAKDEEKVYFRAGQGDLGIVEKANPETFETIKLKDEYSHFAKDDKNLYYDGTLLKDADYNSFKVLSENYAIDKNNLYYLYYHYFFNEDGKVEFKDNVKPDLQSLEYLGDNFFKDNKFIYNHSYFGYEGKNHLVKMNEFDVNTFKIINDYYAIDKNNIYYLVHVTGSDYVVNIVENADFDTFKIVNDRWAKDKNNCYFDGVIEEMEGCEALSVN